MDNLAIVRLRETTHGAWVAEKRIDLERYLPLYGGKTEDQARTNAIAGMVDADGLRIQFEGEAEIHAPGNLAA